MSASVPPRRSGSGSRPTRSEALRTLSYACLIYPSTMTHTCHNAGRLASSPLIQLGAYCIAQCDMFQLAFSWCARGDMRRRKFIISLGAAAAVWPVRGGGAPAHDARGLLNSASPVPDAPIGAAFRQGINETGYVENKNVTIKMSAFPSWQPI